MIRALLPRCNGPHLMVNLLQNLHSHMLCLCVFMCVSDIPGQRPWNLTWFNNVRVTALCRITFTLTHTHMHAGVPLRVCVEGYRVVRLFFFALTGRVALRHTLTQARKCTDTRPTHIHTCMQPYHLASIIPFVWSSKQLANSMNYYNPVRHHGCCCAGRCVCVEGASTTI